DMLGDFALSTSAATLARGIGDAKLFEKLMLRAEGASARGCGGDEAPDGLRILAQVNIMEIAEVYLECGRPLAAQSRMDLMYEVSTYRSTESEALRERIRAALENLSDEAGNPGG